MTFDFRASQLRTSKIIASGSTGTRAKILLYPIDSEGTPLNQGNLSPSLFGTGSIGNDVFLYVSGVIGGIGASTNGISLFGGDVYVSGNFQTERNITASSFFSQRNIAFSDGTAFSGSLSSSLTANRLWRLPDASGDLLITNRVLAGPNITVNSYSNGYVAISSSITSSVPTFAQVYSASTTMHEGSSFTGTNGLGTATPSTLTLSIPSATGATAWADMPHFMKDIQCDLLNTDFRARLAAASGYNGNTFFPMAIRDASGNSAFFMQVTAINGIVSVYDAGGLVLVTSTGTITFSGDEWFRAVFRDGFLTVYLGSGSLGSVNWTPILRSNSFRYATSLSTYTYLSFNLYQGGGAAGTVSVQWADVQSTKLS